MKMWSGRFRESSDPLFEDWQRSFPFDRLLLGQEIAASRAYAEALRAAGVLDAGEAKAIVAGLERILAEGTPQDDPAIEDVHHFVEARLAEIIGETAYKLHTGRSRNEQISTDLRLFVREQIDGLREAIVELLEALAEQARKAGQHAMPAYTHTQRAEPVLVAHWLLGYAEMLLRDLGRLHDCRARANECPLGSGAVAGTLLKLDRVALARALGFDRPTANSVDATSDRDFVLELVQACALLAVHLSRMAEEFILFATQEFGFVQLPEAYATGSSAMPQKKNPDALELARGKAGRIAGDAVTLLMTVKGLTQSYNKDLQETQQPLFDAAGQALGMVRVMAGFVRAVEFDFARMEVAAGTGFLNAFAAAACLAEQGVPFRRAHELVGGAVRLCVERGIELQELAPEDWKQCGIEVDVAALRARLTTAAVLAAHDVEGGTAPARVRAALAALEERTSALKGAIHAHA